jgi:hypothetical protein
MSTIDNLLDPIVIPRMVRVKQRFERPVIHDVVGEFKKKIAQRNVMAELKPGQRIAIGVGSRGIANLPAIVKALVAEFRNARAEPFLVPAMGSHGGGTAEGQRDTLIRMGCSEEYVGAPILATMDAVKVGVAANGLPVFFDKNALTADATVFINRIKPHTAFRGPYESGLLKFIAIGLGKHKGAVICHDLGFEAMAENIPAIARVSLARTNILFAVGLVENAYHETCRVEVLRNNEIEAEEPALQAEAKRLCAKIYFGEFDVLVVDQMGKDISGPGIDPNVIGRHHTRLCSGGPSVNRIAVLDVTDKSHGNVNGIGIADVTTRRLFDKISFEHTYPNALTSTLPSGTRIPMVMNNDKQALQACIRTCNRLNKEDVTVVRIKNTLALDEIEISENLGVCARQIKYVEPCGSPYDLSFDAAGNLF